MKRFKILFQLKNAKQIANGTSPIYKRIILEKRIEIATKRYAPSSKWNGATKKIIGNTEVVRNINAYLKCANKMFTKSNMNWLLAEKNYHWKI